MFNKVRIATIESDAAAINGAKIIANPEINFDIVMRKRNSNDKRKMCNHL